MIEPSPGGGAFALARSPGTRSGRRLRSCALSLVLLGSLGASALRGQPSKTFADRLRVLEVEVPVQVLLDGRPVRGLTADDFRVFDRGEPREVVGFDVLDLSVEQAVEEGPGPEAAAPPSVASRSFLGIVDFTNSNPGTLGRGLVALRQMVDEQLHPSDRMALVGLGQRGTASIVTGFTPDRERLGLALDYLDALADRKRKRQREAIAALQETDPRSAGERSRAYGRAAVEAFGSGLDSVLLTAGPEIDTSMASEVGAQLGSGAGRGAGSGIEEAFALGTSLSGYQRYRDTKLYAEALGNLGALLSGVSGQKHALLLSQGPPFDTFVTSAGGGAQAPPRDGGQGVAKAIERMTEQLSRSGWRIHTLGQGLGFNASLFYLAHETGGTAFENYNRLEVATAELIEQTSVTYLLRILASDVVADGRRHELEVELVDPPGGVEVRHGPNYYAPRPDGELSDVERQMAEAERRLERASRVLRAGLATVSLRESAERSHVLIGLSIDAAEIRELSGRGVVEMEIFATEGSRDPSDSLLYRVTLDQQTIVRMPAGGVTFLGDLNVPASAARLDVRVLVEDRRLVRSIALGGGTRGATQALQPLFFVSSGERLLLREANQGRPFEWPLRLGEEEIVPWIEPAVARGERLGAMLWLLGSLPSRLPNPVFVLTGDGGLRPETEGIVSSREATSSEAAAADGRTAHLAVIETAELAAGTYRLEVLWPGIDHPPLLATFRVLEPRP